MKTIQDLYILRKLVELIECDRLISASNCVYLDSYVVEQLFDSSDTGYLEREISSLFPDYQISAEFTVDQGDPRKDIPDRAFYAITIGNRKLYFDLFEKLGVTKQRRFSLENPKYTLGIGLAIDMQSNYLEWKSKKIKVGLNNAKYGIFLREMLKAYPLTVSVDELYVSFGGDPTDSAKSKDIGDVRTNLIKRLQNGLGMTNVETDQLIIHVADKGYKIGCSVEIVT